jgi:5,10-methylene-tetrahydrofolate dehydrogenase/methenyl tetrahydrofolate cyclohydrolase
LGFLVGKPISDWLNGKCKEIYLLDVGSDLGILKNADLVILGVGKTGLVKPEMLKENAFVIDFGYSMEDGKICGDFEPPSGHSPSAISYTPTPGGTGPILVAQLFENFYRLTGQK